MDQIGTGMAQGWKKAVLGFTAGLAAVGVLIAFAHMPVRTGCGFYNQCGGAPTDDGNATE